jgi:hypothetical protein
MKFDPSVNNFISQPGNYSLQYEANTLKAVKGGTHHITPDVLNQLEHTVDEVAQQALYILRTQEKGKVGLGLPKEMEGNLLKWCEDSIGTPEYQKRLNAANKIGTSYATKSTTLVLSNMGLTSLPNALSELTHLHTLRLSSNHLKHLPQAIGNFASLQILDASNNQLESLPRIGNLKQLTQLILSGNELKKFPQEIGDLKSLIILGLNHTRMEKLPDTVGQLVNLKELYIAGNVLQSLPPELATCQKLTLVYARHNLLTALPQLLALLPSTTQLNISGNPLSKQALDNFQGEIQKIKKNQPKCGPQVTAD